MSRLSKQLHRILDGLENSPRQRNTDQPPCEYQLDCGRSGMIFGRHSISWVYAGCLPAVTASCALSASFCGLKWKRGFTGLTKRLQNSPITNSPAITNM